MTSNGYPDGFPTKTDVQALVNIVNGSQLLNRHLVQICQINGLRHTGVKAELQRRIVDRIRECANDPASFTQIMGSIDRVRQNRNNGAQALQISPQTPPVSVKGSNASTPHSAANMHSPYYQGYTAAQPAGRGPNYAVAGGLLNNNQNQYQRPLPGYQQFAMRTDPSPPYWPDRILTVPAFTFKPSPFCEPRTLLCEVKTCEPMPQHKNSIKMEIKTQDLQRHLAEPSMRIMVFAAAANSGVQEIAFPYQSEIKVNGEEVKANLRGLKNKPGSTRPVDITDFLRQKQANYINNVEFIWAQTSKRYYVCFYACQTYSVSNLVSKLKNGNKISRASVVQEISRKAQDTEIVTTSQKLSLKCPLSYMRLGVPVRSVACKHIQCFDATSYLQLQEQGPQWICPICSILAPFDKLAVDEYAREILDNTSKSVDQVTIEPDGEWKMPGAQAVEIKDEQPDAGYIDDDDLIISDVSLLGRPRNTITPSRSIPIPSTPNTGVSREGSSMPRSATASNAGTKRPAPVVVDLTLSDDDDDPPQPPAKRLNVGSQNVWYN